MLKIEPVIRDVVKIDKTIAVYDTLRDNPDNLFGVVFDWTGEVEQVSRDE